MRDRRPSRGGLTLAIAVVAALIAMPPAGTPGAPGNEPLSVHLGHATGSAGAARGPSIGGPTRPAASTGGASTGWSDVSSAVGPGPSARDFAAMTYDAADGYLVLFGGWNNTQLTPLGDTWILGGGRWTQLHPAIAPPFRRGASMAYDAYDNEVILFGGNANGTMLNDTWRFSAGNWTDLSAQPANATNTPAPRFLASVTYDPVDAALVLFGGCQFNGCPYQLNDTWEFRAGNWTQLAPALSPPVRGGGTMAWDPAAGAIVLYGGTLASGLHSNQTWSYSAGTWRTVNASGPGPLGDEFLAWDSADELLLLFGGLLDSPSGGNGPVGATWAFINGSWVAFDSYLASTPSARWAIEDETGTFDPARSGVVLFGGRNVAAVSQGDTWAFASPLVVAWNATGYDGLVDHPVQFTSNATGGSHVYRWTFLGFPIGCTPTWGAFSCSFPAPGSFALELSVVDSVGVEANRTIDLTFVLPIAAVAFANRSAGPAPLSVAFNATPSGGSLPRTISWDFGDGSSPASEGSVPVDHVYITAGTYSAVCTTTDAAGRQAQVRISILVVPPLRVQVAATEFVGLAPLVVDFTANTSGGLGPLAFDWNFGDGGTASVPNATYVFTGAGTFPATLSVSDTVGERVLAGVNVTVVPSMSVGLALSASPVSEGSLVTLTASVTWTPVGAAPLVSFSWQGLPPGCLGGNTSEVSCRPSSPGTFTVNVTVVDQLQSTFAVTTLTVSANPVTGSGGGNSPFPLEVALLVGSGALAAGLAVWRLRRGRSRSETSTYARGASSTGKGPDSTGGPSAMGGPPRGPLEPAAAAVALSSEPPAAGPPLAAVGPSPVAPARTIGEQILVHLYRQGRLEDGETASLGFTQEGIAQGIGKSQNVFAKVLSRLEASGHVRADARHVHGLERRRKVYRLTPKGEEEALRLR